MYKCICSIHSVHKCVSVFVLDRSACPQIFQEFKSTDIKYKTRLRSRISNLKDQKNPDLRRNVLCGNISPHRIASMTAEVRRADTLSHCYLIEGFVWVLCGAKEKFLSQRRSVFWAQLEPFLISYQCSWVILMFGSLESVSGGYNHTEARRDKWRHLFFC